MVKTLIQGVKFKVPASTLYDTYLDSKRHSAATGSPAKIGRKPGEEIMAWDGYIHGHRLAAVPRSFIAHTWSAADWDDDDTESLLVLHFAAAPGGSKLTMVHAGIPDNQEKNLNQGWNDSYWKPWKKYFARK